MNDPVDALPSRHHIVDLVDATGCTLTALARAAGVSRESVYRINREGMRISADTEAKILALTPEDLLNATPPTDEVVLRKLIRGERVELPAGGKHAYHVALRQRGWNKLQIAEATRSSHAQVRASLLAADLDRARLEVTRWADAYHSATRREKAWQEYARRMEVALSKVRDIADIYHLKVIQDAIRAALTKEAS
jgi:predicted transcriptional regulator